ncbi:MAG: 16S rRNA (adenine(1518)-N(6)/adenine(1519)-N(6))-dimethyltransferase RsmA [Candidatus Kapaibacteriota bacterium]
MNESKVFPKKSLGQNFLIDSNIARKIVESSGIQPGDFVLEIGPGKGALTKFLIECSIFYVGIEVDKNLIPLLNEFKEKNNNIFFEILCGDFLLFDEEHWVNEFGQKIFLLGNIPYSLSSPILFKLLDRRQFYKKAIMMVQREVANRIVAIPGTKDFSILSVLIQTFANARKLFDVSPRCFFPAPKVFSSVISIEFKNEFLSDERYPIFKEIVKLAFNQRRKMISNSLFKRLGLNVDTCGNDPNLSFFVSKRAEELSFNDFLHLVDLLISRFPNNVKVFDRGNRL